MKKWKLKLMKQAAEQLPQGKQMVRQLGADILKVNPVAKDNAGLLLDPKNTTWHQHLKVISGQLKSISRIPKIERS